jgi:hypothetical protein
MGKRGGAGQFGLSAVAVKQPRVLAQQARAHRVKPRRGDRSRALLPQQVGEPQSQLAGRARAERDGEDLVGPRLLRLEQMRDPVDEGPGLPGPWARDQKQRAGAVRDGLGLLGRWRPASRLVPGSA